MKLIILGLCIGGFAFIYANYEKSTEGEIDVKSAPILDRILGGAAVPMKKMPYVVSILRFGSHDCGGSIVNEHYVLTAGHCIHRDENSTIRAGAGLWRKGDIHRAIEFILHPRHDDRNLKHYDIGLIKVDPPFNFSDEIQAVQLPKPMETPPPGTKVLVSGWGAISLDPKKMPDKLHAASLYVISNEKCDKYYPKQIMDFMLCAGIDGGGRDACFGDSGGPLVDEKGVQVGVVSWGPFSVCASPETPYGVYTNVAVMRDWISNVTGV